MKATRHIRRRQRGGARKLEITFTPKVVEKKKKKKHKKKKEKKAKREKKEKKPKRDWGDWQANRKPGKHYYICDDGMLDQCIRKLSQGDPKNDPGEKRRIYHTPDAWKICSAQHRKFCP